MRVPKLYLFTLYEARPALLGCTIHGNAQLQLPNAPF
jgi:hypothetical protein